VLSLVGVLVVAPDAFGWGKIAHRVISIVAERRLSPNAAVAVRELLEPGESLADASLWADEHRREIRGSAGWHYINVPIDESHYSARYCPDSGCVVSKTLEMRSILANPSAPLDERRQALRFFVHLLEDLHQPVHVGDRGDRGGNDLQVRFFESGTNLHRLWDEGLIEHHSEDEAAWVREIEPMTVPGQHRRWCEGTVEDYATESLLAARNAYLVPGSSTFIQPGELLGGAYFEAARPVVVKRLAQAALRLSCALNDVFRAAQRTPAGKVSR
jgi:hypothetical protein